MEEDQIEATATVSSQIPFSMVVKPGEELPISFEGNETLFLALSLVEVKGEKPTKPTKVSVKYIDLLDDEKKEEKTVEIAELTPENCDTVDIQFNCAKDNNPVVIVDGDCSVEISGIYYDGGSDDDEEEEEEEQKEEEKKEEEDKKEEEKKEE